LRPDVERSHYANLVDKFEKTVSESGGQILKPSEEWGERALAFEVQHHKQGYFVLMPFAGTPEQVKRLEERFQLDENVLRYQIVRTH
jgi:small subunit ribosomal protein S6